VDEGFIFVTNNTADFSNLYGREDLHVGLVCLNAAAGMMSLALQRRLFLLAMSELGGAEPYNQIVEITAESTGDVDISRYALP